MDTLILTLLVIAAVAGGAFLLNEWSGGGVAEMFGLGERHMLAFEHEDAHAAAHAAGLAAAQPGRVAR